MPLGALLGGDPLPVLGLCDRRGGASLPSIPTGTFSAAWAVFGSSVPAGRHVPVPIHGFSALAALLCRALSTVNRPIELPVRSASYTVPDSSAMGTGIRLVCGRVPEFAVDQNRDRHQ